MGKINVVRVILGGLLAGLVINISESVLNLVVVADAMELALRQLNVPPAAGGTVAIFVVFAFLLGIVTVWLYAAIRPRFGPGPKTAVLAGLLVWLLAYLWPTLGDGLMGLFDAGLLVLAVVWGLVEIIIAALAGGWVYKEV
jgi:hypothetical protein